MHGAKIWYIDLRGCLHSPLGLYIKRKASKMEKNAEIKRIAECAMLSLSDSEVAQLQFAIESSEKSCEILCDMTYKECGEGSNITDSDKEAKREADRVPLRADEANIWDRETAKAIMTAVPRAAENCIAVPRVVD